MKENLLKKLDELGISPITENDVFLAMKKAVGNPVYWFFFKRKNLAENINFTTSMLSIVCIAMLFIAGAFISVTPFADKFISNHIGPYLFFGLCATLTIATISGIISTNITAWHKERSRCMWDLQDLKDPLSKKLRRFENALDYNSEYYKEGMRLSEQRVNKTRFIFVRDRSDNRCCAIISAIETE